MHSKSRLAAAVAITCVSSVAAAQSYLRPAYRFPEGPASASGPASIQLGGSPVHFTPYLGLAVGYDDNLFLSRNNEKSSTLYVFSPGFMLDARGESKVFQIKHQSQAGRYAQSDDDNYVDHTTRAQFDMAFDRRNFLRLMLDHIRGHDPRGSTDRAIAGRPDRYRLVSPQVTYAFGAPGAAGRLEAYASEGDKTYLNNRATTVGSDRKTRELGGVFYWRAMPRTYVLAEARKTSIDYDLSTSPFSGDEKRYYAGLMWEATAATTGTIKVGRLQREFDSTLPSYSGTSWEGLVTWSPRTYSRFDFYTARQTNESTGLGSFILSSVTGATWTHAWSSVVSTGVDVRFQKDDYQNFNRSDDVKSVGLKIGYKFRRWLTLGAEFSHTQRDSNLPTFEYDRNLYLLTATGTL